MLESETSTKITQPTNEKNRESTSPQKETSSQVSSESQPTSNSAGVKTIFTQPFKKGQYHEQIKALQTFLKNQGYYQGEINGVNTQATIQALYQFQLKKGIITGKENNKSGYGRLGPKTRTVINNLIE